MKDSKKAEVFKDSIAEELALVYAIEGNKPASQLHIQNQAKNLVFDWENTPVMIPEARWRLIENFSSIMDIKRYVDLEGISLPRLLNIWSNDKPGEADSLLFRDKLFSRRYRFLAEMKSVDERPLEDSVSSVQLQMALDLVNFSLSQKNNYISFKTLEKASEFHEDPRYPLALKSAYDLTYARATSFRVKSDEPLRSLKWLLKGQEILNEIPADQLDNPLAAKVIEEKARACSIAARTLATLRESGAALPNSQVEKIKSYWRVSPTWRKEKIYSDLAERGRKHMVESVSKTTSDDGQAEEHLKMAKYCAQMLESTILNDEVKNELLKGRINGILYSMKNGCREARDIVPSLLPLIESNKELGKLFVDKALDVPSWMFLTWHNQLFAWLPTEAQDVVAPLVLRLCQDYPLGLLYSYRVSRSSWGNRVAAATREKIERLLTPPTIYDTFLAALKYVAIPAAVANAFLKDCQEKLARNEISDLKKAYKEFSQDMFHTKTNLRGVAYENFSRKWEQEFSKVFGSVEIKISEVTALLKAVTAKELNRNSSNVVLLKDLSPWLSNYRPMSSGDSIELPGQYTSDQRPMQQHHTFIDSFEPTVLVLPSLRRPVRLSIVGSDARSYNFLVKFGEDLRQDERIEKLFEVTNSVLKKNPATRTRGLRIRTYKVFPLSPRLGLIEWMEGVITMRDFLAFTKEDEARYNRSRSEYARLYKSTKDYAEGYEKFTEEEVVSNYEEAVRVGVPSDKMRNSLEKMSRSLEGFYRLRLSFCRSHGTLSVVHWILGIGDRHTSNNLISQKTGESIGIDFGYAFGNATEFLPVPEVVPVRITPQIAGVNAPLGLSGPIKASMVSTLNALKEDSDTFLAILDVFVKEPSVDWLALARRAAQTTTGSKKAEELLWFPQKKVEMCRSKLKDGLNPAHATFQDLGKRPYLNAFKNVIIGGEDSRRNQLGERGLSPSDQVSCLIDQSTDSNVLGRTWIGWDPFL